MGSELQSLELTSRSDALRIPFYHQEEYIDEIAILVEKWKITKIVQYIEGEKGGKRKEQFKG